MHHQASAEPSATKAQAHNPALRRRVSTREAADIVGVAAKTLIKWRHEGRGPSYVRLPGSRMIRYPVEALEEFLAQGRHIPARSRRGQGAGLRPVSEIVRAVVAGEAHERPKTA